MNKLTILFLIVLAACAPPIKPMDAPSTIGVSSTEANSANRADSNVDILANLPEPSCKKGLTLADQEGPYYKSNTPERNSLLEGEMQGKRLILAGYVLNPDCFPIPHVWLDFWQADANGKYDNTGYTLRGHQYTDNKGRYYLETILPGKYPERPIEHIHVKLQAQAGDVFTTQLYFPSQPVAGLTIDMEDKGDYYLGSYNLVIK